VTDLRFQSAESPFFLEFSTHEDSRGKLVSVEFSRIPFSVNRYFAISINNTDFTRGGHAHKECWQAFFASHGSLKLVIKNLSGTLQFDLKGEELLIVPPYNWCEIHFNEVDSVMGVFASHSYDPGDYLISEPPLE
jgi:hypothetical protein